MREVLEWTVTIWNRYWGNGVIQYLLLLSVIYLLLRRRKESDIRQIFPYLLTVLILFVCPVTAKIIQKCIGADVYWRVLWLLPATPVISLACTELLHKKNSRVLRFALVALCAVLIVLGTGNLLRSGEYTRVGNYQKVPNEVANICSMVREHAGDDDNIRLAADEHVASYVRVYDPELHMPYGRRGYGTRSKYARRLYSAVNQSEEMNYKRIAKLSRITKCDFIAIPLTDTFDSTVMEAFGYLQIGTVNHYGIFQQTEPWPEKS